jgi:hypothetical protein
MVTVTIYVVAAIAALFCAFVFGLGLGALSTIIRDRKFRANLSRSEALCALAGEILLNGHRLNLSDVAKQLQARGGSLAVAGDYLEYSLAITANHKELALLLLEDAERLEPVKAIK